MIESTWLASDDPIQLLREPLLSRASDRKALLAALACWHQSGDFAVEGSDRMFAAMEKYADGVFTRDQLDRAFVDEAVHDGAPFGAFDRREAELYFHDTRIDASILSQIVRDIFGNPFRPVAFDPVWRTADTTGIAARMYDSREFAAMPILADALEEAGSTNADVLLHCREQGVHVRGCWVVDSVLGKC